MRQLESFWKKLTSSDAQDIRKSLRSYPNSKGGFMWLLDSCCLTFDVFFHTRIGKDYFGFVKGLAGCFFFLFCLVLYHWEMKVVIHYSPYTPGFIRWFPTFDLPSWKDIPRVFEGVWEALVLSWKLIRSVFTGEEHLIKDGSVFGLVIGLYGLVVNLHIVLRKLLLHTGLVLDDSSNGQPWVIWNPLYRLGHALRLEGDIVKQFGEPLLLLVIANLVLGHFDYSVGTGEYDSNGDEIMRLAEGYFVGIWFYMGAIVLFIRNGLENRWRGREIQEERSFEIQAEAMEAAEKLRGPSKRQKRRRTRQPKP